MHENILLSFLKKIEKLIVAERKHNFLVVKLFMEHDWKWKIVQRNVCVYGNSFANGKFHLTNEYISGFTTNH